MKIRPIAVTAFISLLFQLHHTYSIPGMQKFKQHQFFLSYFYF